MVTTIRTWNFDHNHAVAGANELAQAQDACFRMLELLRGNVGVDASGVAASDGSWLVHSSSKGDGTVNLSGDDIAASTDIVFGTGAVNHSWIVFYRTFSTKTLYLCFDFDLASGRDISLYMYPSAPTTPGTATSRPLHTGGYLMPQDTIFTAAGFTPRTTHGWRNDAGEFIFCFAQNGGTAPTTTIACFVPANGEAGLPWKPFCYFAHSATGSLSYNVYSTASNWGGFWIDDSSYGASAMGIGGLFTSAYGGWALGRSNVSGGVFDAPIDMLSNATGKAAYLGRIVDIRAAPNLTPSNETQSGDTELVRRIVVDDLWMPYRAAGGSLTW